MLNSPPQQAEILRNQLVTANLGLVHTYARRLGPPFGFHGQDIDDVASDFTLVLFAVIDRWQPDVDPPLQMILWTAARERVRQKRDTETGWSGASGGRRRWAKVTSAARRLEGSLGRPVSDDELSADCGVAADEIHELRSRFERSGDGVLSLDASADFAPTVDGTAVAAAGESTVFIAQMAELVTGRDPVAGQAFRTRFGLDGPPPPENQPWQLVADRCGCSIRTAQRLVTQARMWVADWLTNETTP